MVTVQEAAGGPVAVRDERKAPLIIIVGADKGGVGKAQPLSSKIATPSGWRAMGDMKVGTPICGTDGKTYQVSGIYPQGALPSYRVTFTDDTSVECSADHLWSTKNIYNWKRDGWSVKTTAQLMKLKLYNEAGQSYAYSIPIIDAVEFASASMPVDAYTLGVLIGDGTLATSPVAFSVPSTKEPIKQRVAARLGEHHRLTGPHGSESAPQWHICGGDKGKTTMAFAIRQLGLACNSKQRFIPEIYKTASVTDRLELLRGLMDTDGSSQEGRTSFSSLSAQLAADLAELVRSLGGVAIVRRYDRTDEDKGIEWRVNVRMTICPFSLDYKAAGWVPAGQNRGKYFKSIELVGEAMMQCISTTAPDKLYVTDGYNATHNTTVTRALLDYLARRQVDFRAVDTEPEPGVLTRFGKNVALINAATVPGQMAIIDRAADNSITIVDARAGLLTPILKAFHRIDLLRDVREGKLRLLVLHVVGASVASGSEIQPVMTALQGANLIRVDCETAPDMAFPAKVPGEVAIKVPYLDAVAYDSVDAAGASFMLHASDPKCSRVISGYIIDWLRTVHAAFDAAGIGAML